MEESKFIHKQIKLPLFPVYYDIFFVQDLLLAPAIISSKYPGIDVHTTPSGSSMTCIAIDSLGNKGVIALFSLNRQEEEPSIEENIIFESTNLAWQILDLLEINVDQDNFKMHSYLVAEISQRIREVHESYEANDDSFDKDPDNLGDI